GESPRARGGHAKPPARSRGEDMVQLSLFDGFAHPVVERLRKLDLNTVTPLQALNLLNELKQQSE
ncbi:MAG: hypothetical protein NTW86_07690, partial [Candidatus Sumerlaeota bacterium]|nr:hypothetical protein [Candidatus Sumerlaeota bacterium]